MEEYLSIDNQPVKPGRFDFTPILIDNGRLKRIEAVLSLDKSEPLPSRDTISVVYRKGGTLDIDFLITEHTISPKSGVHLFHLVSAGSPRSGEFDPEAFK